MARDITQLHPRLQAIIPKLIEECEKQGVPIKIGECFRSVAEQDALYAQGRSTRGAIVTNCKGSTYSSQHQWGIACDFFLDFDVDGDGAKADDAFNNATRGFEKVGAIAKSLGLGWGGDWTSPVDRPHLYLPDWGATTTKLKAAYGTPDKFKATWDKESSTPTPVKTTSPTPKWFGVVNVKVGSTLRVRKGPGTNYANLFSLKKNSEILVYSSKTGTDGDKWFYISYNGVFGYVHSDYIVKMSLVKNGYDYSLVFDPVYYAEKYPDIMKAFGYNGKKLFTHFLTYGMKEGRQAISTFNVHVYKKNYADLQKAFVNNLPAYYKHYIKHGKKEKRKAV